MGVLKFVARKFFVLVALLIVHRAFPWLIDIREMFRGGIC